MKENFVETISINSQPYVFRYELQPALQAYTITILNHKEIEPFEIVCENGDHWKIKEDVNDYFKAAESLLCAAIVANNDSTGFVKA